MSGDKLMAQAESALNGTGTVKKLFSFMGVSGPPKEEAKDLFTEAGNEYSSQGEYFKSGMAHLRAGDLATELKQFPKVHYMEAHTQFNNGGHQVHSMYARLKQISPSDARHERARINEQIAKGCANFPAYQALACDLFFQAAEAYKQDAPANGRSSYVQAIDLAIMLSEPVSQTFPLNDEAERALRDRTLASVANLRKLAGTEHSKAPMNPNEVPALPEGLEIAKKMADVALSNPSNATARINVGDFVERLLLLLIVQGASLAEFEKSFGNLSNYFQHAFSQVRWFEEVITIWASQNYDAVPKLGQMQEVTWFSQAEKYLVNRVIAVIQNRIRQGFDANPEYASQSQPVGPGPVAADSEWDD